MERQRRGSRQVRCGHKNEDCFIHEVFFRRCSRQPEEGSGGKSQRRGPSARSARSGHRFLVGNDGAEGGIRTHTPYGATPSRWCVCQFRHFRNGRVARRILSWTPAGFKLPNSSCREDRPEGEILDRTCRCLTSILAGPVAWPSAAIWQGPVERVACRGRIAGHPELPEPS